MELPIEYDPTTHEFYSLENEWIYCGHDAYLYHQIERLHYHGYYHNTAICFGRWTTEGKQTNSRCKKVPPQPNNIKLWLRLTEE